MQLPRHPRALLLLQAEDALVERLQLAVGQPVLLDAQGQAAGEHHQHHDQGHAGNGDHGGEDAAGDLGADLAGGLLDVLQVDAGAEHPAPALQHRHVGQLVGLPPARRLAPGIALEAVAARGALQQRLHRGQAVGVGHVPQVLADQLGLARVHQVAALGVVDEEVAVRAEAELGQDRQRLLLGVGVAAAAVVQRGDEAECHGHVVLQLGPLAGEDGVLDQLRLLLAELLVLPDDQGADHRYRQQQGQDAEGNDLVLELHGASRGEGGERALWVPGLRRVLRSST
ncbi:hypothetical protein D3C78_996170 [compost metagenome]